MRAPKDLNPAAQESSYLLICVIQALASFATKDFSPKQTEGHHTSYKTGGAEGELYRVNRTYSLPIF
jgi:hypothetical protein